MKKEDTASGLQSNFTISQTQPGQLSSRHKEVLFSMG